RERMVEELDYRIEADNQRAFAKGFVDDEHIVVPRVVASAPKVMVSEWVEGTPLAATIKDGTREERDAAGHLLSLFHFSAPERSGLLHADPHPGNFMTLPDGRLCVIDFGAVARLPEGLPHTLGVLTRLALQGRSEDLMQLLRAERFLGQDTDLDAQDVLSYLAPFVEPMGAERFHFTRSWLQRQAERISNLRGADFRTGRFLNLPPSYLLIHRVTMGSIGILCQLDAEVPAREIVTRWQPGFAEED
uniref:AarF/UbiB family protein n=1 Tax=Allokutzneria sp. NRRL B-24872 TaxID=1137961 RepID=UPI00143CF7E6